MAMLFMQGGFITRIDATRAVFRDGGGADLFKSDQFVTHICTQSGGLILHESHHLSTRPVTASADSVLDALIGQVGPGMAPSWRGDATHERLVKLRHALSRYDARRGQWR